MKKQTAFQKAIYQTVARIPKGKVMSYAAVAKKAGFPGAARAVGTAMKHNIDPKKVPCHRVVRWDGSVGEYAFGGRQKKMTRLKAEGIQFSKAGKVLK